MVDCLCVLTQDSWVTSYHGWNPQNSPGKKLACMLGKAVPVACVSSLKVLNSTVCRTQPLLNSNVWKLRKYLHHQLSAFPHPPRTPEPQQAILRPTLAVTWVPWAMDCCEHQFPVLSLVFRGSLAVAGVSGSCRSAPSFLCDVSRLQPRGLLIGHDAVRIYNRELQENSWNGEGGSLAISRRLHNTESPLHLHFPFLGASSHLTSVWWYTPIWTGNSSFTYPKQN